MKPMLQYLFLATTFVLATGAIARPASARSVVAYAGGRSGNQLQSNCFSEYWAAP